MNSSAEQRRSARATVEVPATLQISGRQMQAKTANISEGGAFVALPDPPPVGTMVKLALDLGDGVVRAFSEVVWIRLPGSGPSPGMGLRFRYFLHDGRDVLRGFLWEASATG
ncbi:MAG: PilZ domain-containing protein [Thermoanaerobaculia bacterium]